MGRITIGKNTAVEDNVVLHAGSLNTSNQGLAIGDSVQIGHAAAINCKRIGNSVLAGMNATLLHDAEIGNYCIIAAGSLVSQAMKIPDKSFVAGIPGKIKGEVTEEQLRWVEQAPRQYYKLMNMYKSEFG
jgi:carbonic anhydrase/acetyltransferase-like protein (isoleucine patch superfamily)